MGRGSKVEIPEKDRQEIQAMAGFGMRNVDIAAVKGIAYRTLKRLCKLELSVGRAKGKAGVQKTAYQMATSGKSAVMTIFFLKTKCGWKESTNTEKDLPFDLKETPTEDLKTYVKANTSNRGRTRTKR